MRKYAVFFDADGTIFDMRKGVPSNTADAIKKLVDNGHHAWLCTGRSRAFIPQQLKQLPFTGIICAAGCTIEKNEKILFNKEMSKEIAKISVQILRKYNIIPVLEGADYLYYDTEEYDNSVDSFAESTTNILGEHYLPIKGNENNLQINKICAKIRYNSKLDDACKELERYFDIIHHENGALAGTSIELIPKGHSKASAIETVLKLEQIPHENSVCFGDSNNDIPMFQYAAYKIAMGDASPKIIQLADYVTEDMFHNGIYNGLKHLKLI